MKHLNRYSKIYIKHRKIEGTDILINMGEATYEKFNSVNGCLVLERGLVGLDLDEYGKITTKFLKVNQLTSWLQSDRAKHLDLLYNCPVCSLIEITTMLNPQRLRKGRFIYAYNRDCLINIRERTYQMYRQDTGCCEIGNIVLCKNHCDLLFEPTATFPMSTYSDIVRFEHLVPAVDYVTKSDIFKLLDETTFNANPINRSCGS